MTCLSSSLLIYTFKLENKKWREHLNDGDSWLPFPDDSYLICLLFSFPRLLV